MAIFDRLKLGGKGGGGAPEGESAGQEGVPEGVVFLSDPAKAARFFERAKAVHDTTNYEYATTLWLQGLRQDPTSMSGLEAFYGSAQAFAQGAKATKPTKDQTSNFGGKGDLEKYLEELLHWGVRPGDVSRGLKVMEYAARLHLTEPGYWIGQRVLLAALQEKTRKNDYLSLMKALQRLGAFDLAVKAGEAAHSLDRSDGNLEAELRNLAAQSTMAKGGYEKSGQAGGFRANIKNLEAQRRIEEEGRVVKSEDALARVLAAAKADYESRPQDGAAITKYARALRERGTPEDEKTAFDLLMKAHKELQEFRFRQDAGEIRLKNARRKVAQLKQRAEADPSNAQFAEESRRAGEAYIKMELEELTLRSEAYPTDLGLKLDLGVRHFLLGQDEKAIGYFQEARSDPKSRARAANYLGQSFLRMGWADEAIDSLRAALASIEVQSDDLGMDVRYNLMLALERKARDQSDLAAADEAYRVASAIAIQQIGYRDIRAKRDELQRLARELKNPGAAAPPPPASSA